MEFKTELDYEMKRFNKEKEVKKLNEELEKNIVALNLIPPLMSGDIVATPMPNPALIEIQADHRKALKLFAKENGYNLVYQHLTALDEEDNAGD